MDGVLLVILELSFVVDGLLSSSSMVKLPPFTKIPFGLATFTFRVTFLNVRSPVFAIIRLPFRGIVTSLQRTLVFIIFQSPVDGGSFPAGLQSPIGGGATQSLSFVESHPAAGLQQPSLSVQVVISVWVQTALQLFGKEHKSVVHTSPSLHTGSFGEVQAGVVHVFKQHSCQAWQFRQVALQKGAGGQPGGGGRLPRVSVTFKVFPPHGLVTFMATIPPPNIIPLYIVLI